MKKIIYFFLVFLILFSSYAQVLADDFEEGYSTFYNLVFVNDEFIDRMLRGGVSSIDLENFLDDIDEQISMFREKIYMSDMDEYFIYLFLQTLQKEEHIDALLSFDMMYQEEMVYMLEKRKCPESLQNLMMTSFGDKVIVEGTVIDEPEENIPEVITVTPPEIKKELPFSDIKEEDWFAPAVCSLYEKGIINGKTDGLFHPEQEIKFEEAVKMIVCTVFGNKESFENDSSGKWYEPYVRVAEKHSLLYGLFDSEFIPDMRISRQDMATVCFRAVKNADIEIKQNRPSTDFYDISSFKYYAVEPIRELQQWGIINGVGNNYFAPEGYLTRGEAAEIINNILNNI